MINAAIGYEYRLKKAVSLMVSARTDNSYFDEKVHDAVGINSQLTTWDIYHFTGGITITKGRSQLSIGLLYSTGADADKRQDGNYNNPSEDNFLLGSTSIVKATYSSIGLLLGYTFSFKKILDASALIHENLRQLITMTIPQKKKLGFSFISCISRISLARLFLLTTAPSFCLTVK